MLTGNGDVTHKECTSSLEMGMCLSGNVHPHREWGCASPAMYILTGNAHSLYRLELEQIKARLNPTSTHKENSSYSLLFSTTSLKPVKITNKASRDKFQIRF